MSSTATPAKALPDVADRAHRDQKTDTFDTRPVVHAGASLQGMAGNHAVSQLLGRGAPLPAHVRAEMERRFGASFADVRVHDGPKAYDIAAAMKAKALTCGGDIVFGRGQFAPSAPAGRRLLAHELAHVVQQTRGGLIPQVSGGAFETALETNANRAADALLAGGPVAVEGASAPGIARQPLETQQPRDVEAPARADVAAAADDAIARVRSRLSAVEGMRFLGQAGRYSIELDGRLLEIDEIQYQHNRESAAAAIVALTNTVRSGAADVEATYQHIVDTNRLYSPVVAATEFFYGVPPSSEEMIASLPLARYYANQAEENLSHNGFVEAFEKLLLGDAALRECKSAVLAYREQLLANTTLLADAVDGYRKALTNAMIGIGAVLLAPEALTVGAVALIVGGAAGVGGATEGGMDVTKQAIRGGDVDPAHAWGEAVAGAKAGGTAAVSTLVTGGVARVLGPTTTLPQTAIRFGVAGSAGGAVGGGLGAALEGKSVEDAALATVRGSREGLIGGMLGGPATALTGGLRLPARMLIDAASSSAAAGAGAWTVGRSPNEIAQAMFSAGFTGGAIHSLTPSETPASAQSGDSQTAHETAPATALQSTSSGKGALWQEVGVDIDYGISVYRSGDLLVGVHPDLPDMLFLPQPEGLPKVYARGPAGAVTEVPWPFARRSTAEPGAAEAASASETGLTRAETEPAKSAPTTVAVNSVSPSSRRAAGRTDETVAQGSAKSTAEAEAQTPAAATTTRTITASHGMLEDLLTQIDDPQSLILSGASSDAPVSGETPASNVPSSDTTADVASGEPTSMVPFSPWPGAGRAAGNMAGALSEASNLKFYETHAHLKGAAPYGRIITLSMVNAVATRGTAGQVPRLRHLAEDWYWTAWRLLVSERRDLGAAHGLWVRLQDFFQEVEQLSNDVQRLPPRELADRVQQARETAMDLGLEIEAVFSMPIDLTNDPEFTRFFPFFGHVGQTVDRRAVGAERAASGQIEALRFQTEGGTAGLEARSGRPLPQGQHVDLASGNRQVPYVDPMPAGTTRIVPVITQVANDIRAWQNLLTTQVQGERRPLSFAPPEISGYELSGVEQEGQGPGVLVDISLRTHADNWRALVDWLDDNPATAAAVAGRLGNDIFETLMHECELVMNAWSARDEYIFDPVNPRIPPPLDASVPLASFAHHLRQVYETIAVLHADAAADPDVAREASAGTLPRSMRGITIHAGEQLMSGEISLAGELTLMEEAIAAGTDRIGHGTILGIKFPDDLPKLGFRWTGSYWTREVPTSSGNQSRTQDIGPEEIAGLEARRRAALARIAELGIVVEVPPTSNIRLQGFNMFEHPVARMLADQPDSRVVPATDNPTIHRTDIRRETALLAANTLLSSSQRAVMMLDTWASRLGARPLRNGAALRDDIAAGIQTNTPPAERLAVLQALYERWPVGDTPPTAADAATEQAFVERLRSLVRAVIY